MRVTRSSDMRTMPTEKQYLYYLIVSQLYNDGHTEAAIQLEMTALQSTGCVKAGDRLNRMLSACVASFNDVSNFLEEQKAQTLLHMDQSFSRSRKRPLPSPTIDPISSTSIASNILHANTDNTSSQTNLQDSIRKCVKLVTNDLAIANTLLKSVPSTPENINVSTAGTQDGFTPNITIQSETNPPEIPIQDIDTDTQVSLNDPKEYPKINITNPLTSPVATLDVDNIQNVETTHGISNFNNLTKDLEEICKAVAEELPLPANYAELVEKPKTSDTEVKEEIEIKTEQIDPAELEDSNSMLNNLTASIMGSLVQYQADTPGPSADYSTFIDSQKSGMDNMLMGYNESNLNTTDVMVPASGEPTNSEAPRRTPLKVTAKEATSTKATSKRRATKIPFKLKLECVKYGLDKGSNWARAAKTFNIRYPKYYFKQSIIIDWSEKVKIHLRKLRDKEYFSNAQSKTSDQPEADEAKDISTVDSEIPIVDKNCDLGSAKEFASPLESATDFASLLRGAKDFAGPLGSAKDFASPLESAKDFSNPLRSAKDFANPLRSAKDFAGPLGSAKDFASPLESAKDFTNPLVSAKDFASPLRSAKDFASPLGSAKDFANPLRSAKDFASPLESAKEFVNPLISATDFASLLRSATEFASPLESAKHIASPLSSAKDFASPLSSAKENPSLEIFTENNPPSSTLIISQENILDKRKKKREKSSKRKRGLSLELYNRKENLMLDQETLRKMEDVNKSTEIHHVTCPPQEVVICPEFVPSREEINEQLCGGEISELLDEMEALEEVKNELGMI